MTAPIVPAGYVLVPDAQEAVAWRVTGEFTDLPFKDASAADAYISGLLKTHPEGGYKKSPLYAAPLSAPAKAYPDRVAEQLRTWRAEVARLQNLIQYTEAGVYPGSGDGA